MEEENIKAQISEKENAFAGKLEGSQLLATVKENISTAELVLSTSKQELEDGLAALDNIY